jgi:3-phosphoshikimate 1-carboxyvinyltransferase
MLILNALSKSPYPIENLSGSDDTRVLLEALQSGKTDLNIGAAGTSMRFLTAYLAQLEGTWFITGTERMKNRPIKLLVNALRDLGAEIDYLEKEGFPPLKIHGKKLKGGTLSFDGSISSQYISALMMIAPIMGKGLSIRLEGDIVSKPYIKMTRRLMEDFGIDVLVEEPSIVIEPQNYIAQVCKVESDWSAASYWYEIIALSENSSSVELLGLQEESVQGDAGVAAIFKCLGVSTEFTASGVILRKESVGREDHNKPDSLFQYNFVDEPDLAQTLVVSCCLSGIPFCFNGLQSLRIKETDRIGALQTEMRKLGFVIKDKNDNTLEWTGERCKPVATPVISTYEDHRMAMAFAPVCMKTNTIQIENPEVVSKSYPRYWDDLAKAGFAIH